MTTMSLLCGGGSLALTFLGAAASSVTDAPWMQGGAFALAAAMIWFWRKDVRERERGMGVIIDRHRKDVAELSEVYRKDMKEMHERTINAINDLCQRPCMAESNKPKETPP